MVSESKKVLVLTRWFPNAVQPVKCVFNRNIVRACAQAGKYSYKVVSPVPVSSRLFEMLAAKPAFSMLPESIGENSYTVHYPRYWKLPFGLGTQKEWKSYLGAVTRWVDSSGYKPDIVHSHGIYPDGKAAVELGGKLGVPVVLHIHESYMLDSMNLYREVLSRAEKLIAVSRFQEENIAKIDEAFREKSVLIYNGVEMPVSEQKNYSRKKGMRIVFAGNLIPVKGLEVLLEALSGIDDRNIKLDVFGEGRCRRMYEKLSLKLGLHERVCFRGAVANPQFLQELPSYSLLVLPSRYETFGLVVLEALSRGVPVVASNTGALPELVCPDRNGLLVKPGDVSGLADAIESAVKRNWDMRDLHASVSKFDISRTAGQIEDLYGKLLQ